jgi:PAS domain S-box-containing protein
MKQPPTPKDERTLLLDEIEQLTASLETALEENARLIDDRERLLPMARDLEARLAQRETALDAARAAQRGEQQSEEALRIAFEELQVMTEELEVANTTLHEVNQQLDVRVEERTRQLSETNASLRAAEASFGTVVNLVPDLLWRADPNGKATWFNQRWFDYTGDSPSAPLGSGWIAAIHPQDRALSRSMWAAAITSGSSYQREHRLRASDGGYRWHLTRAVPLRDEMGRIVNWFATGTDIDDQRIAMEQLEQSELRFRVLIEGMPQLVWRAIHGGKWTWCSPQWTDYTGQTQAESHNLGWQDAIHRDDRPAVRQAWAEAAASGTLEFEARIFHVSEGRHRRFRTRALAVRGENGRIIEWLGTSTDVDDLLQLQDQQEVLVKELQHRTRNLMAVVHAVTMRTIRDADSLEEFEICIDDRLQALARVQGLLSRREATVKVPFDLLLRDELAAHVALDPQGNSDKVSIAGPSGVPLRSASVQTLALALHELATNAAKYGALAAPEGHLHVRWSVSQEERPVLSVDWRETGVTMSQVNVVRPGGGYGRELIERALPYQLGARTSYNFEEDGVHCTIDLAISPDGLPLEKDNG